MTPRHSIYVFILLVLCASFACAAENPYLVVDSGGHNGLIRNVLFTRDGRFVVSAGDDKTVRVWNARTGELFRTIRGEIDDQSGGSIYAMDLSPDNKYIAVGGFLLSHPNNFRRPPFGFIRIIDFESGRTVKSFRTIHTVESLAFSPNGRLLAGGTQWGYVEFWDLLTMENIDLTTADGNLVSNHQHTDHVYALAFSSEGKLVSGSDDGTLKLYTFASSQPQTLESVKTLFRGTEQIKSAAFSPGSRFLATGHERVIRLWDGHSGRLIKKLKQQNTGVRGLTFDSTGRSLLVGSDSAIEPMNEALEDVCHVYSVPEGKTKVSFDRQQDSFVLATAISPNGEIAATAGGANFEIYLWQLKNGKVLRKLAGSGRRVRSVGYKLDGQSIGIGNTRKFKNDNYRGPLERVISLPDKGRFRVFLGEKVKNQSDFLRAIDSQGGLQLTTAIGGEHNQNNVLVVFKNGQEQYRISRDPTSGYQHNAYTLTKDGTRIVSGGGNGELTSYSVTDGTRLWDFREMGHTNTVLSVAVSPDDRTLVSGSIDQTVKLWDLESGKNLLSIFVGEDEEWVAWTPQGYYTSSLNGDKYIGWHRNNGLDKTADFYSAEQFRKDFYRPDVVAEYLTTRDIKVAVRNANQKSGDTSSRQGVLDAATVSSSLPPIIEIDAPKENESTVHTEFLRVRARVTSKTLPITGVRIFHNGSLVGSLETNSLETEVSTGIRLKPDLNVLTIVASNALVYSAPAIRKINFRATAGRTRVEPLDSVRNHRVPSAATLVRASMRGVSLQDSKSSRLLSLERLGRTIASRANPPRIVFVEPETDGRTVSDASLAVKATVTSTDSPISKVTLFVNNEDQGSWSPGGFEAIPKFKAFLRPGLNEVKLTASDQSSTSEQTKTVVYQAQATSDRRNLIFLGIGVNQTKEPTLTQLSYAERDVTEVAKVLQKQEGPGKLFNRVIARVIPGNLDPVASRTAINGGLRWMDEQASKQSNNVHVIYLAGHGAIDKNRNYYLLSTDHVAPPGDDNDVPWSTIKRYLGDLIFHGNVLLFVDTCHAGSSSSVADLLSLVDKYELKETGVAFFLASDEQGISKESGDWDGGHGAFTAALIRGLNGQADKAPYGNDDGKVSLGELDVFIKDKVPQFHERQKPNSWWIHGSKVDGVFLSQPGNQ